MPRLLYFPEGGKRSDEKFSDFRVKPHLNPNHEKWHQLNMCPGCWTEGWDVQGAHSNLMLVPQYLEKGLHRRLILEAGCTYEMDYILKDYTKWVCLVPPGKHSDVAKS